MLDRVGCAPGEGLMVGDRIERDGAAAAALGVPFLLRAEAGPEGVARVSDFREMAARLARGEAIAA